MYRMFGCSVYDEPVSCRRCAYSNGKVRFPSFLSCVPRGRMSLGDSSHISQTMPTLLSRRICDPGPHQNKLCLFPTTPSSASLTPPLYSPPCSLEVFSHRLNSDPKQMRFRRKCCLLGAFERDSPGPPTLSCAPSAPAATFRPLPRTVARTPPVARRRARHARRNRLDKSKVLARFILHQGATHDVLNSTGYWWKKLFMVSGKSP